LYSPARSRRGKSTISQEDIVMQRIVTLVALCAIFHTPAQSRGDDQPNQPAPFIQQGLRVDKQQVLVRVRMIEVSLTKMREAGLKYPELAGSPLSKGDGKPSSDGHSHMPGLIGIASPGHPLFAFLDDLQKEGLAKTVAEPALITVSGRQANFLSGGQIPILNQRVNGNLSTEFAEFGSEVNLKPEVLDGGRIRLNVKSRFAELDKSLEVSAGGRIVPGLRVRECQASADVASGDTMVLGGMPDNVIEYTNRHGTVLEQTNEKETLALVTPRLIDPNEQDGKSVANHANGYYGPSGDKQPSLHARPTGNDAAGQSPAGAGDKE
jgi:Flp pilus assembly secretin CpaC